MAEDKVASTAVADVRRIRVATRRDHKVSHLRDDASFRTWIVEPASEEALKEVVHPEQGALSRPPRPQAAGFAVVVRNQGRVIADYRNPLAKSRKHIAFALLPFRRQPKPAREFRLPDEKLELAWELLRLRHVVDDDLVSRGLFDEPPKRLHRRGDASPIRLRVCHVLFRGLVVEDHEHDLAVLHQFKRLVLWRGRNLHMEQGRIRQGGFKRRNILLNTSSGDRGKRRASDKNDFRHCLLRPSDYLTNITRPGPPL